MAHPRARLHGHSVWPAAGDNGAGPACLGTGAGVGAVEGGARETA